MRKKNENRAEYITPAKARSRMLKNMGIEKKDSSSDAARNRMIQRYTNKRK